MEVQHFATVPDSGQIFRQGCHASGTDASLLKLWASRANPVKLSISARYAADVVCRRPPRNGRTRKRRRRRRPRRQCHHNERRSGSTTWRTYGENARLQLGVLQRRCWTGDDKIYSIVF